MDACKVENNDDQERQFKLRINNKKSASINMRHFLVE